MSAFVIKKLRNLHSFATKCVVHDLTLDREPVFADLALGSVPEMVFITLTVVIKQ